MVEFFNTYAPLLWFITTGLVVIALAWLAWLSFGREETAPAQALEVDDVRGITEQVAHSLWSNPGIQDMLAVSLQRVGLERYDAYPDTGGQRSFSLALTDALGNGVVISSLHGRSNTRVYARPLFAWESETQLSNEELAAIEQVRGQRGPATTPAGV